MTKHLDHTPKKQKTLLVLPEIKGEHHERSRQWRAEEAIGLAQAISLEVLGVEFTPLSSPKPATLLGSGKIREIADIISYREIVLAVVDFSLTPIQQRNLEREWKCKVIDRTALILEIFGERAQTREGQLQVELAALQYQKSRLVRSWTHLERQRGGFGFLGGPGESQIETDRRLIRDRISKIKKELEKVVRTRDLQRSSRRKVPYTVIALVGYTNAGKSTLFNRLTGSKVIAEDKLFATLDPTLRLLKLPSGEKVILSDTVGFVSNLPTELIAAFRATLEEVIDADLILHVRDISSEETEVQKNDVHDVIAQLGIEEKFKKNSIEVLNKIDLLDTVEKKHIRPGARKIPISASTGEGIDNLIKAIEKWLEHNLDDVEVILAPDDGAGIAWLHQNARVTGIEQLDDAIKLYVKISAPNLKKLEQRLHKHNLKQTA